MEPAKRHPPALNRSIFLRLAELSLQRSLTHMQKTTRAWQMLRSSFIKHRMHLAPRCNPYSITCTLRLDLIEKTSCRTTA